MIIYGYIYIWMISILKMMIFHSYMLVHQRVKQM